MFHWCQRTWYFHNGFALDINFHQIFHGALCSTKKHSFLTCDNAGLILELDIQWVLLYCNFIWRLGLIPLSYYLAIYIWGDISLSAQRKLEVYHEVQNSVLWIILYSFCLLYLYTHTRKHWRILESENHRCWYENIITYGNIFFLGNWEVFLQIYEVSFSWYFERVFTFL